MSAVARRACRRADPPAEPTVGPSIGSGAFAVALLCACGFACQPSGGRDVPSPNDGSRHAPAISVVESAVPAPGPSHANGEQPAGDPAPDDTLSPTIEQREAHVVVQVPGGAEDVVAIAGGAAFVHAGTIWRVTAEGPRLTSLVTVSDPHALATDGAVLAWFGAEDNGALDLVTLDRKPFPGLAPPPLRQDLAFGDAWYARVSDTQLWRVEGMHVERLDAGLSRAWMVRGLAAGAGVVVVPVVDPPGRASFLWRVDRRGKGTRLDVGSIQPRLWDVQADGDVLFARDDTVFRVGVGATRPKAIVAVPGITAVCGCGSQVCTLSAASQELVRHDGRATLRWSLEGNLNPDAGLSCTAAYAAWAADEQVRVVTLSAP